MAPNIKYVFFALLVVMSSCQKDIDTCIIDSIQKNGIDYVNLSDATWFDWDTMYYFSNEVTLEEIMQLSEFKPIEWTDVGDRVFFCKNNLVVYWKEWFPYYDGKSKEIVFELPANMRYFKIPKDDCRFSVSTEGNIFKLTPMSIMKIDSLKN